MEWLESSCSRVSNIESPDIIKYKWQVLLTKGLFGYNWKLKLKTEKYCSKIIFKCMNGTVRPIFNEKVAEKWNLWVCKQCTVCTDWLKRMRKVKLCGYYSLNIAWTVPISLTNACQKKKKEKKEKKNAKRQTQTPNLNVAFVLTWSHREV